MHVGHFADGMRKNTIHKLCFQIGLIFFKLIECSYTKHLAKTFHYTCNLVSITQIIILEYLAIYRSDTI